MLKNVTKKIKIKNVKPSFLTTVLSNKRTYLQYLQLRPPHRPSKETHSGIHEDLPLSEVWDCEDAYEAIGEKEWATLFNVHSLSNGWPPEAGTPIVEERTKDEFDVAVKSVLDLGRFQSGLFAAGELGDPSLLVKAILAEFKLRETTREEAVRIVVALVRTAKVIVDPTTLVSVTVDTTLGRLQDQVQRSPTFKSILERLRELGGERLVRAFLDLWELAMVLLSTAVSSAIVAFLWEKLDEVLGNDPGGAKQKMRTALERFIERKNQLHAEELKRALETTRDRKQLVEKALETLKDLHDDCRDEQARERILATTKRLTETDERLASALDTLPTSGDSYELTMYVLWVEDVIVPTREDLRLLGTPLHVTRLPNSVF